MAPFDRPHTTFYRLAIVSTALFCTIFKLFGIDLVIWVRGHSRSLKLVPFERLGTVSYLTFAVTMALFYIVSEIKQDIG